jgi:hypothetical protein
VSEPIAEMVVAATGAYVAVGLLFAFAFLTAGVSRIDPAAREAALGFRLIIMPGVVTFWPLLAVRWARKVSR